MNKNTLLSLLLSLTATVAYADPYTTMPITNNTDCQIVGEDYTTATAKVVTPVTIFSYYLNDSKKMTYYGSIAPHQSANIPVVTQPLSMGAIYLGFSPDPNYWTGSYSFMAQLPLKVTHIVQYVNPTSKTFPRTPFVYTLTDDDYQRICGQVINKS